MPTVTATPVASSGFLYADIPIWSGTTELLDVYLPTGWSGSQALPTILFIHGGGSRGGDKGQPLLFFRRMMDLGYPVVSTNYTLVTTDDCSTGAYPDAIHDIRAAVDWIHRSGGTQPVGQDVCLPTCVVAVGTSTGAYHAALIGVLDGANDGGFFDPGITGGDYEVDLSVLVSGSVNLYGYGADGDCPETACHQSPLNVTFPGPGLCGGPSNATPYVDADPLPLGAPGPGPFEWSGFPSGFPPLSVSGWAALPWGDELPNGCWPPELFLGCEWGTGPCSQGNPGTLPTNVITNNEFANASPMNWVDSGDADFLIYHGVCDFRAPFHAVEELRDELLAAGSYVVLEQELSSDHGMSSAADGLLTPFQAANLIDAEIADWMAAGGCSGSLSASFRPLGCGATPRSLRVGAGRPALGSEMVLAIDALPTRALEGTRSVLALSTRALSCRGEVGESGRLGVDLSRRISPLLRGTPWRGSLRPSEVQLRIPDETSLLGAKVYVQGAMLDPAPGVPWALTDVLELTLGL